MNADRPVRLWSLVVEHAGGKPASIGNVCTAILSEARVDGAAVTVTLDAGQRETMYASDRIASGLAELALTFGEGPSLDACSGSPVLVADLESRDSTARWPVFAPAAVTIGARATFALPLQVGGIGLGVVDLYRGRPGPLSPERMADGLMLADTACALLIDSASGGFPNPDGRGPEQARLQHPEVHQATGMIIAQLGVPAAVAFVRLRAYAYAHDRRLRDVARDVVARRLRFYPDKGGD